MRLPFVAPVVQGILILALGASTTDARAFSKTALGVLDGKSGVGSWSHVEKVNGTVKEKRNVGTKVASGCIVFAHDALGSIVARVDASNTAATTLQRFDAWGTLRGVPYVKPAAGQNQLAYTGHIFDPETGLHYAKARYLDNGLGRFLSEDPLLGRLEQATTVNRFNYARGNPTRYTDPDGRCTRRPDGTYDCLPDAADMALQVMSDTGDAYSRGDVVSALEGTVLVPASFVYGFNAMAFDVAATPVNGLIRIGGGMKEGNPVKTTMGWVQLAVGLLPVVGEELIVVGRTWLEPVGGAAEGLLPSKNLVTVTETKPPVVEPIRAPAPAPAGQGTTTPMSGPVLARAPPGATAAEKAQVKEYCRLCNQAIKDDALSPTGKVSTKGDLRRRGSQAAKKEKRRAEKAGTPYAGQAGHVPDSTWTGNENPPFWQDLTPAVNTSLGGQTNAYPVGYKPTEFVYVEDPPSPLLPKPPGSDGKP